MVIDFSEPMLTAARQRFSNNPNAHTLLLDYGKQGWEEQLLKIILNKKQGIYSLVFYFDVIINNQDFYIAKLSVSHWVDTLYRILWALPIYNDDSDIHVHTVDENNAQILLARISQ